MKNFLVALSLATLGSLVVMLMVILADIGLRQGAGIIAGVWAGIAGTSAVFWLTKSRQGQ